MISEEQSRLTRDDIRTALRERANRIGHHAPILAEEYVGREDDFLAGRDLGISLKDMAEWARVTPAAVNKALHRARRRGQRNGQ